MAQPSQFESVQCFCGKNNGNETFYQTPCKHYFCQTCYSYKIIADMILCTCGSYMNTKELKILELAFNPQSNQSQKQPQRMSMGIVYNPTDFDSSGLQRAGSLQGNLIQNPYQNPSQDPDNYFDKIQGQGLSQTYNSKVANPDFMQNQNQNQNFNPQAYQTYQPQGYQQTGQQNTNQTPPQSQATCQTHKLPAYFVCLNCNDLVCQVCTSEKCQQQAHQVESLKQGLQAYKTKISSLVSSNSIQIKIEALDRNIKSNQNIISQFKAQEQLSKKEIENQIQNIKDLLDQTQKQLFDKIETQVSQVLQTQTGLNQPLESQLQRIKEIQQRSLNVLNEQNLQNLIQLNAQWDNLNKEQYQSNPELNKEVKFQVNYQEVEQIKKSLGCLAQFEITDQQNLKRNNSASNDFSLQNQKIQGQNTNLIGNQGQYQNVQYQQQQSNIQQPQSSNISSNQYLNLQGQAQQQTYQVKEYLQQQQIQQYNLNPQQVQHANQVTQLIYNNNPQQQVNIDVAIQQSKLYQDPYEALKNYYEREQILKLQQPTNPQQQNQQLQYQTWQEQQAYPQQSYGQNPKIQENYNQYQNIQYQQPQPVSVQQPQQYNIIRSQENNLQGQPQQQNMQQTEYLSQQQIQQNNLSPQQVQQVNQLIQLIQDNIPQQQVDIEIAIRQSKLYPDPYVALKNYQEKIVNQNQQQPAYPQQYQPQIRQDQQPQQNQRPIQNVQSNQDQIYRQFISKELIDQYSLKETDILNILKTMRLIDQNNKQDFFNVSLIIDLLQIHQHNYEKVALQYLGFA